MNKRTTEFYTLLSNGLWHNNQALVALLGLCPLLAVSNSVVNAAGLGIATLIIVTISNACVSVLRPLVSRENRIVIYVALIATLVTCIERIMLAYWHDLALGLGVFVALIVTNCAILGRAEAFASKNNLISSILDGAFVGVGFLWVLVILGAVRELLATGKIFAQMHLLLGGNIDWTVVLSDGSPLLLAAFPAGAFIVLGLLIAVFQAIKQHNAQIVSASTAKAQHST